MDVHHLAHLLERRAATGRQYLEYVRSAALSVGVYVLPTGGVDRQRPHSEDEAYYVVSGRARMTVGDETRDVTAGDTIFVAATVAHRFHDILEELVIVVFFAPPEGSLAR